MRASSVPMLEFPDSDGDEEASASSSAGAAE